MISPRGIVYTFYSFKGGVGRSMALANVAALLAKREARVLVIDWDLEAPGLEKYFSKPPAVLKGSRKKTPGVVDLVSSFATGKRIDWRECLLYAQPFKEGLPVSILTAGQDTEDYVKSVQNLQWDHLFLKGFGSYLEELREEWVSKFDYVLVDSRTGITDIGGICTIHLPDILVLLFTANDQSLDGVTDVITRAKKSYSSLPFDRAKLLAVPVPSRFENVTEYKLAAEWKQIFAERLAPIYKDWLPDKTIPHDILEKLFIPYVPFWSFGEGLPVVKEGTSDPRTLGFAYDLLARLLERRLQWNEVVQGDLGLSSERSSESVDQAAERTYDSLDPLKREEARQILMRLVRVGRAGEDDTKRRVAESEFDLEHRQTIKQLLDSRLIYESTDEVTKEPTVEIQQEALLKNWQRLQTWIDENREFLLWRDDLDLKMREWQDSDRDQSLLLDAAGLGKAERIIRQRDDDLNHSEKEFIRISSAERERRRAQERRKRATAYISYAAFVFIVLLFGFFTYYSYLQRERQENELEMERIRSQQQQEEVRQRQKEAEMRLLDLSDKLSELQMQNQRLLEQLARQRNR